MNIHLFSSYLCFSGEKILQTHFSAKALFYQVLHIHRKVKCIYTTCSPLKNYLPEKVDRIYKSHCGVLCRSVWGH